MRILMMLRLAAVAPGLLMGLAVQADQGAFGPDFSGLRLGMSPAQVRAVLLELGGVSEAEFRAYDDALRAPEDSMGRRPLAAEQTALAFERAHKGFRLKEVLSFYLPPACEYARRNERLPAGMKHPTDCPTVQPSGAVLAKPDVSRREFVASTQSQYSRDADDGVTTSLSISFSSVPGAEKVIKILFTQHYREAPVDRRPQLRAVMESLTEKLGPVDYCIPPPGESRSRQDLQAACFWGVGDGRKAAIPVGVEPAFAFHDCAFKKAKPEIEIYPGFTLEQYRTGREPTVDKTKRVDRLTVCGEAIVGVKDVTNDLRQAGRLTPALRIEATWLQGELTSSAHLERTRKALAADFDRAKGELTKGNKPKL